MELFKKRIEEKASVIRPRLLIYNQSKFTQPVSDTKEVYEWILKEKEVLIGGVTASFYWEKAHIDFLWVDEDYRGKKIGQQLLQTVTDFAHEKNSRYLQLETFDFQAPLFYQKMGFEIFGVLDDSPYDGCKQYFLKKELRKTT
ncbi:GNAT family N-acetyltransferase [Vagococcus entomophilus]|uniref:N-acetyltransferase domain-containing protein n=1 Tax=Vagococcus entomophilus TaxID=1160095 RepID=A0A430AKB1_9ENTE|nr:GNAT family N-acetyltransferase [Vagococcus entomophilus]RSU08499.1 hypothetical protein CBF30_04480 [Vagococcus entomophilus]